MNYSIHINILYTVLNISVTQRSKKTSNQTYIPNFLSCIKYEETFNACKKNLKATFFINNENIMHIGLVPLLHKLFKSNVL